VHLVHLNPFPSNLGEVLRRYERILVPEANLGQLSKLVRADFLVDARSITNVRGTPFRVGEIEANILDELGVLDRLPRAVRAETTASQVSRD
jgi:2-oxoglutarate ferredoxin oxidoreductase subunit alpha